MPWCVSQEDIDGLQAPPSDINMPLLSGQLVASSSPGLPSSSSAGLQPFGQQECIQAPAKPLAVKAHQQ